MGGSIQENYPPELSAENEANVIRYIQDWSLANGLVLLSGESNGSGIPAPVTLFPTPFPKTAFLEALAVQKGYNDIYHEIVKNEEWLLKELTDLAKYDPDFTGKLLDIHLKVKKEGESQPLTGGLFRSDYIVHSKTDKSGGQIKQVEFNTVSVSFGGLSTKLSQLHNCLIDGDVYNLSKEGLPTFDKKSTPISPSLTGLAKGLAKMHESYVKGEYGKNRAENDRFAVLFVVQPGEKNALDQRLLEFELFNRYKIPSYRVTLAESETKLKKTTIDSTNILKHVPTDSEISVVYYRSGYSPSDYPSETEWSARQFLESSHAIKSPSVLTQLSGAKKIQQLLTEKSILDKFAKFSRSSLIDNLSSKAGKDGQDIAWLMLDQISSSSIGSLEQTARKRVACLECRQQKARCDGHEKWPVPCSRCTKRKTECNMGPTYDIDYGSAPTNNDDVKLEPTELSKKYDSLLNKIRDTFVKIYPLDESPLGIEARKLAFESPEKFVLKPQREGGGNNIYRDNIPDFLNSIPKENWGAYILMELIEPSESKNKILRTGEVYSGNIISELGVFGAVLWDTKKKISLFNFVPGWLLRTKLETSDEGGVAAGFGCIDSVYFV